MPVIGRSLGDMLLKDGVITGEQLKKAIDKQKETEKCIGRILVDMNVITESQKINYLRKKLGLRVVELEKEEIDTNAVKTIPKSTAEKYHLIPFKFEDGKLLVAMDDPTDIILLDTLETQTKFQVVPVLSTLRDIDNLIIKYSDKLINNEMVVEELPLMTKFFKSLITVLILLIPGGILYWLLQVNRTIQQFFNRISQFEIFLYIFIVWAFWAIIVFYVNSLIFSKEKRII
jgi:hypothetical protein